MSASQEIILLMRAENLQKHISSLGLQQPLRLLAYHCMPDLTPIGLALMGYDVRVVNSNPRNVHHIKRYADIGDKTVSCDSYSVFDMGKRETQPFDIVVVDGLVLTELRSDEQLENVCRQLASTVSPGGSLVVTTADFDETIQVKERVLPPQIVDDHVGRQLKVIVRDWHGSGYEYTETHYNVTHSDGSPTVTYRTYQRRAWRNAELALALMEAGFEDVTWKNDDQHLRLLSAKNGG